MSEFYTNWCVRFKESKPQDHDSVKYNMMRGNVESRLRKIHHIMKLSAKISDHVVNYDNVLLVQKQESNEYATYFDALGEG